MIQTILTRIVIPVLILASGFVAMLSMGFRQAEKRENPSTADFVEVQTEFVMPHEGDLDINVDGVVMPHREIGIAAEVGGRVIRKDDAIRAGRFVTAGTVLLEIDPSDYQIAMDQATQQQRQVEEELHEIGVETDNVLSLIELAKRELALQQGEYERTKRLFEGNRTSQTQLDQAERAVIVAENSLKTLENQLSLNDVRRARLEASLELAKIQVRRAQLDLERTRIVSPVDGVIVRDQVEQDGYVKKGDILFTVEDTAFVEVECKLQMDDLYWIWRQSVDPDDEAAKDQALAYQIPRTPVTVTYQFSGRKDLKFSWKGSLSRYESIGMDERTRTVPCRVIVDDPRNVTVTAKNRGEALTGPAGPPALVRGMYVTVTIHAQPFAEFVKVPECCVQPGKRIWRVIPDGHEGLMLDFLEDVPLARLVTEGDRDPRRYWLIPAADAGLAVGDRLVSVPVLGMRPGVAVRLLDADSTATISNGQSR